MRERLVHNRDDIAPSLLRWAGEALQIPPLLASPLRRAVPVAAGNGQAVMVLPGYQTGDLSSIRLRRSLRAAGYAAYGWGLGKNRGARVDLLDRLEERLVVISQRNGGQKVALVGWSLGGIYARELAKRRSDLVSLVVTLGSPFSGSPRANNAWRLYEFLNDHPVDNPPLPIERESKPPVTTIAVWSPIDGIVAPAAARGLPHESDHQIELPLHHLALARNHRGIRLIGELLSRYSAAA